MKFRFWGVFRSLLSMAVRKSSPSFRLASSNPSHGSPSRMRIPPGTRDRLTTSPATRNSLGSRMAWLRPFMNTFALVLMVPDIYFLVSPCQGVRTGRRCGCLKFFSSMKGHRLPAQGATLRLFDSLAIGATDPIKPGRHGSRGYFPPRSSRGVGAQSGLLLPNVQIRTALQQIGTARSA